MASLSDFYSWTAKDIQNEEKYVSSILPIPDVFEEVRNWSESFDACILEELRYQLNDAVNLCRDNLPVEFSFDDKYRFERLRGKIKIPAYLNSKNEISGFTGSICIFAKRSTKKGRSLGDAIAESPHFLTKVIVIEDNEYRDDEAAGDDAGSRSSIANILLMNVSGEFTEDRGVGWSLYVLGCPIVPIERLCDALQSTSMLNNNKVIRELIGCDKRHESSYYLQDSEATPPSVPSKNLLRRLNPSQLAAISKVSAASRGSAARLQIIHGPPGTGKTATLVGLIDALVRNGQEVYVTAPTNQAICAIAQRVLKDILTTRSDPGGLRLVEAVLVGNASRLVPFKGSEQLYIEDRVTRLKQAFGATSQWWVSQASDTEDRVASLKSVSTTEELVAAIREVLVAVDKAMEVAAVVAGEAPRSLSRDSYRHALRAEIVPQVLQHRLDLSNLLVKVQEQKNTASKYRCSGDGQNDRAALVVEFKALLTDTVASLDSIYTILQTFFPRDDKALKASILSEAKVILSTVSAAGSKPMRLVKERFEVVIIDEATQLVEAATAIMFSHKLKCLVLAGDNKQLPATVISQLAAGNGYGRSLFDRMLTNGHPSSLLNIQYRMHPSISSWPNRQFYGGLIADGENVTGLSYKNKFWYKEDQFPPLSVYDVRGNEERDESGSMYNMPEVEVAVGIVRSLRALFRQHHDALIKGEQGKKTAADIMSSSITLLDDMAKATSGTVSGVPLCDLEATSLRIGVITPYTAQLKILDSRLKGMNFVSDAVSVNEKSGDGDTAGSSDGRVAFSVVAKTVDGFQGQECDIIIFVAVRSNDKGNLGFLTDARRLNVAITRAKYSLIVIGDRSTLCGDRNWRDFLTSSPDMPCRTQEDCQTFLGALEKTQRKHNRAASIRDPKCAPYEKTKWGKGKISLVDSFVVSFKKIASDSKRMEIMALLLRISDGRWPQKCRGATATATRRSSAAAQSAGPTASATADLIDGIVYCTPIEGLVVIWSIELQEQRDRDHSGGECQVIWWQVIRIRYLVQPHEVSRMKDRIANYLRTFSPAYLDRCRYATRDNSPQFWLPDESFRKLNDALTSAGTGAGGGGSAVASSSSQEDTEVNQSLGLMKSYPMTSSVGRSMLRQKQSSIEFEFPHDVSAEEAALIEIDGVSKFVLGRSGTGKTTVMLHRMFRLAVAHEELCEEFKDTTAADIDDDIVEPLRQMMVTASPVLAADIKAQYEKMLYTYQIGLESVADPDQEQQVSSRMASISLTAAEASIFTDRRRSGGRPDGDDGLQGLAFDQLCADHFPLIITYEMFLGLINRSLENPFEPPLALSSSSPDRDAADRGACLVDFNRFCSYYFGRLGDKGEFRVDASGLFMEIISVIKGSLAAVKQASGRLDCEAYLALAERRESALDVKPRKNIYSLFERYQQLKAQTGDYDIADYVGYLYRSLSASPYRGPKLQYVYVDEVQDLTPAQLVLLRFVCDDPNGYFLAGDTAQTIAHGVGFRFETLKDLFHSEFLQGKQGSYVVPRISHLTKNFRTHSGILNLANTVVKMLLHFFPNTIDALADETSLIEGHKPVFLEDTEDVVSTLFNGGDVDYDFGSEQVILVRNDAVKRRLIETCGKKALVLTVLEAKGMEFTDCLLYNIFSGTETAAAAASSARSTAGSSGTGSSIWRVLGGAYGALGLPSEDGKPFTKFDPTVHSILCTELKNVYVLLTRAKQRLFIFESNVEARKPIMSLWSKLDAIKVQYFNEEMKMVLKNKNTPAEWCTRGNEFFSRGGRLYETAMICFKRGADRKMECLSRGKFLFVQATELGANDAKAAQAKFIEAAIIFENPPVADQKEAAFAYMKGNAFEKAATLYTAMQKWSEAGYCYGRGRFFLRAARAYEKAKDLTQVMRVCEMGAQYDTGLEIVKNLAGESSEEYIEWVIKAADHHSNDNLDEMMKFVDILDVERRRQFYRERLMYTMLQQLEVKEGNLKEAARLYEAVGNYDAAAQYFAESGDFIAAATCQVRIVRLAHLDSVFLPLKAAPASSSRSVDVVNIAEKLEEYRTADIAAASSPAIVKTREKDWRSFQLELEVVQKACTNTLTVDKLSEWKEKLVEASACTRLTLTVLRCMLKAVDHGRMQRRSAVIQESRFTWRHVREAVVELVKCVDKLIDGLYTPLERYMETFRIDSEQTNALLMLFDLFEIRTDTSGGRRPVLLRDDIDAARALWPTPKNATKAPSSSKAGSTILGKRQGISAKEFASSAETFLADVKHFAQDLMARELKGPLKEAKEHFKLKPMYERFSNSFADTDTSPEELARIKNRESEQRYLLLDACKVSEETPSILLVFNPQTAGRGSNASQIDIDFHLERELFPLLQYGLTDMDTVLRLRSDPFVRDRFLVRSRVTVSAKSQSHETIASVLLAADLMAFDKASITVLQVIGKRKTEIARKEKNADRCKNVEANDSRLQLCRAFCLQFKANGTNGKMVASPDGEGDAAAVKSIFTSLDLGICYLTSPQSEEDNPMYYGANCLTPLTFIALAEKFLCPLLFFCSTVASIGVALPESLLKDLFYRESDNNPYAAMLRAFINDPSLRSTYENPAVRLRDRLLQVIIDLLGEGTQSLRERVDIARIQFPFNDVCSNEGVNIFILRAVRLALMTLASICVLEELSWYLDRFRAALGVTGNHNNKKLLHGLPAPLVNYLKALNTGNFSLASFSAVMSELNDPLVFIHVGEAKNVPHYVLAAKTLKHAVAVVETSDGEHSPHRYSLYFLPVPAEELGPVEADASSATATAAPFKQDTYTGIGQQRRPAHQPFEPSATEAATATSVPDAGQQSEPSNRFQDFADEDEVEEEENDADNHVAV